MDLKLSEIYRLFGKNFKGKDKKISGISTDTRTLKKNNVFFAIKGDKSDGHRFISDAIKKGACLVICERFKNKEKNINYLKVKDTKKALLFLAKYYLKKFPEVKIITITGSNGKTTTKEIVAKVLSQKYEVLKSEKSYNNYLGLSLTIFNLRKKHKILVLEVGMNHKGEIKEMLKGIKTDVAIVTNTGNAHIGFFKNRKEIAVAKSEIFLSLKKGGYAILNKDDDFFYFFKKRLPDVKILSFGKDKTSDIKFEKGDYLKKDMNFKVYYKKRIYNLKTQLRGEHNIYNIIAGILIGFIFRVKENLIIKAIKNFKLKNFLRFEEKYINGIYVINDAYNANIDSFKRAIETLKDMKLNNLYIVAADMLELGEKTKEMHIELGKLLTDIQLKGLFLYGKYSNYVKEGYLYNKGNLDTNLIFSLNDKKQLGKLIKKTVKKGDCVFLKGSRQNKLEEIEEYLK